jgi:hypothetical protein
MLGSPAARGAAVRPDEERSGPPTGRPDTNSPAATVATWADVYDSAERWVEWTARRRWPVFAVNDQIWACSVADWETSGRRAA